MSIDRGKVQQILRTVPSLYRGPGGAIAVLKDGELVDQHTWGYADMERRCPVTPQTLFPVCSITKQFVSWLLYDLMENPPASTLSVNTSITDQLLSQLREVLPRNMVDVQGLTVENLVDMCSGIRDYWALCTLQGSRPETPYLLHEHNPDMLRRIKSLHFQPGTEYSYCNTNFNIVERVIERVTKEPLDKLLNERVFGPAGMTTARICARTDRLPAPIVGYEGTERSGFREAFNFIEWSADAGAVASLNDMIAYEQYVDRTFASESGYRAMVMPRKHKNGELSVYRYGLQWHSVNGVDVVGHGGALRGFRLYRCYVPSERLSVVVLFNHTADCGETVDYVIKQIMGAPKPTTSNIEADRNWFGSFLDHDTQLSVRVRPDIKSGKIKLRYCRAEETLILIDANNAQSRTMRASIDGDKLRVHRSDDNRVLEARRLQRVSDGQTKQSPVQGRYYCEETESTFICEGEGAMLYGMFDGCFGKGPPHLMTHLAEDVWVLADPRAMDDTAPGDWTLVFSRNASGQVEKVTIGCWLARKLVFTRI